MSKRIQWDKKRLDYRHQITVLAPEGPREHREPITAAQIKLLKKLKPKMKLKNLSKLQATRRIADILESRRRARKKKKWSKHGVENPNQVALDSLRARSEKFEEDLKRRRKLAARGVRMEREAPPGKLRG